MTIKVGSRACVLGNNVRYDGGYKASTFWLQPLAPLMLLQHHVKHYPNAYISAQRYFSPYPENPGLRA